MLRITLIALVILLSTITYSQEWLQLYLSGEESFQKIEASYNKYFETHPKEKGTAYKHFERWAWYNRMDLNLDGSLPSTNQKLESYELNRQMVESSQHTNRNSSPWVNLGPDSWVNQTGWNPGIGRVNEVAVDPRDPNVVYAGTPQGGLWKTVDGGATWIPLTDFLPSLGVSGIAIDYTNSNIIYIATGDAYSSASYATGVYKSIDGGLSWDNTGLVWEYTDLNKMRKMCMHPEDPNTLMVATSNGIYKTTDAGDNWYRVVSGNFFDVKYKDGDPSTVYAINIVRFFLSTDGGERFTSISNGYDGTGVNRVAMATTPANPDKVYLLAGSSDDNGFYGFYASSDGGLSFETKSLRTANNNILGYALNGTSTGGQSWYDLALAASPTDENLVFTGGVHIWYTDDGGITFKNLTDWYYPSSQNYVHADIHYLGFWGDRLYSGNDGGVFYSDNNGYEWTDISEGLSINQIYRMSTSPIDPYLIGTGSQDNGCNFMINGSWRHLNGGDGMEVGIDPQNSNILYVSSQYGNVRRSTNGGNSFTGIKPSSEEGAWVTPFKISYSSPNIIYAGYDNLWKTTNRGTSWTNLTNTGGGGTKITQIAVFKNDSDIVYFSRGGSLFRTTDGGQTIQICNLTGTSSGTITYVNISPKNPLQVYITFGGYSEGRKVFMSLDGGQSWNNITRNLPPIPVRCITPDEGDKGGLYIGTQFGVFYTDSTYFDWVPYNTGLPPSQVNEIELQYNLNKIRAATYGRGVWEADLFEPIAIMPVSAFSVTSTTACEGESLQFTNNSQFSQGQIEWVFEGGTPATSNELNPVVTYESSGYYSVTLISNNNFGSDTLTKFNLVKILGSIGATLPIEEIFVDDGPIGIGEYFTDANSASWKLSDESAYTAKRALLLENYYEEDFDLVKEVTTTIFNMKSIQKPVLSMRVALAGRGTNPNFQTRFEVLASKDCGETWISLGIVPRTLLRNGIITNEYYIPQSNSEWAEVIFDQFLPDEQSGLDFYDEKVQLKIAVRLNETANNLWIDDIRIFDGVNTSTNDPQLAKLTEMEVYPNPTSTVCNIKIHGGTYTNSAIKMIDVTGRLVHEVALAANPNQEISIQIPVEKLARGIYFICLENDKEQIRKKLVVH
jgi:PKD repeat protein